MPPVRILPGGHRQIMSYGGADQRSADLLSPPLGRGGQEDSPLRRLARHLDLSPVPVRAAEPLDARLIERTRATVRRQFFAPRRRVADRYKLGHFIQPGTCSEDRSPDPGCQPPFLLK